VAFNIVEVVAFELFQYGRGPLECCVMNDKEDLDLRRSTDKMTREPLIIRTSEEVDAHEN
jgi:hypothetical protein